MPRQKLTQRTDGYFKVKYHDKQFYGKTQAEAMKARDAYKQKEQMGLSHDLEGITFLDYALNWLEIYRSDCSVPLQKQYASMIRFAADHTRKRFICDINANDLQAIFNKLSCYSSSYVSKFASLMNGIFRNAVSNGALIRNPMAGVQRPKCKKTGGHRCLEPWERALIRSTWQEHDFGLAAMVMLYTGFRRGEMLHLNIDRDVDFEKKTIAVRGAVSFSEGNRPKLTKGKTASAIRTVPLLPPLEEALKGRHGLVCHKENGGIMSQSAFACKYESVHHLPGDEAQRHPQALVRQNQRAEAALGGGQAAAVEGNQHPLPRFPRGVLHKSLLRASAAQNAAKLDGTRRCRHDSCHLHEAGQGAGADGCCEDGQLPDPLGSGFRRRMRARRRIPAIL